MHFRVKSDSQKKTSQSSKTKTSPSSKKQTSPSSRKKKSKQDEYISGSSTQKQDNNFDKAKYPSENNQTSISKYRYSSAIDPNEPVTPPPGYSYTKPEDTSPHYPSRHYNPQPHHSRNTKRSNPPPEHYNPPPTQQSAQRKRSNPPPQHYNPQPQHSTTTKWTQNNNPPVQYHNPPNHANSRTHHYAPAQHSSPPRHNNPPQTSYKDPPAQTVYYNGNPGMNCVLFLLV